MTSAEIGAAVLPWAQAVAMAFIPTAGTIAGVWLRNKGINADVIEAAGRGAGAGMAAIVKSGLPRTSAAAVALGEQVATDYLTTMLPGKIASVGLSPAGVANLASAQLGRLLGVTVPATEAPGTMTPAAG